MLIKGIRYFYSDIDRRRYGILKGDNLRVNWHNKIIKREADLYELFYLGIQIRRFRTQKTKLSPTAGPLKLYSIFVSMSFDIKNTFTSKSW